MGSGSETKLKGLIRGRARYRIHSWRIYSRLNASTDSGIPGSGKLYTKSEAKILGKVGGSGYSIPKSMPHSLAHQDHDYLVSKRSHKLRIG